MELAPLVEVENADHNESGTFMLTTVSRYNGNALFYMWAKIYPYAELVEKEDILRENETSEQYKNRQLYMMKISKQDAIIAAFKAAGNDINVKNNGVYVISTSKDLPAEKVLQPGDVITAIEGTSVRTLQDLVEVLKRFKAEDQINLTFLRNGTEQTKPISITNLPKSEDQMNEEDRIGLGFVSGVERTLTTPRKVDIHSEKIGGPSAGFMFTLELLNQISKGDLTKGYRIAGTGTIDSEGNVGQIGGIDHKIVAANRARAELFFTPKDINLPEGAYPGDSNEKDAIRTAKNINTKMKVVPVASLAEALEYLNRLPLNSKE